MNNRTLTIFNSILTMALVVAVVIIFINNKPWNITSKNPVTVRDSINLVNNNATNKVGSFGNLKVVYINTDTLWNKYEFVKLTLKKLEKEQTALQVTYDNRTKKFEKDYNDYLSAAKTSSLSLQQQQYREAELTKQQADIKSLEDEITQKLVIKKQTLNNQINDTILSFINRYRLANGYDMILQYAYLNSILAATPELDVTEDVVDKLNKEYKKFKK